VDVVRDASTDVPKYIRENINDAMGADLPAEHREQLQQYYRRIGAEGGQ